MFPNVEEIHLESNGIFTIDWEAFRLFQLKKLYLSNNHLAVVYFFLILNCIYNH